MWKSGSGAESKIQVLCAKKFAMCKVEAELKAEIKKYFAMCDSDCSLAQCKILSLLQNVQNVLFLEFGEH